MDMHGSAGQTVPRKHKEMTLTEGILYLFAILLRYRWFIAVVTALAVGGVLTFSIYSLRLPPERSPLPNRYEAQATLLFGRDEAQAGFDSVLESLGMTASGTTTNTTGRLVLQILDSNSFLDTIIERNGMIDYYGLDDANRTQRRAVVTANAGVRFDPATSIMTVTYEDIRPEYARRVVDSMVEELEQWFLERSGLSRIRTLELLERTLREVERELADIEGQIRSFQQRYGALTVEELAAAQATVLRGLESELVQLERTIRSVSERTRLTNDPELLALRAERNTVIDLIDQIEAGYAGGDRRLPTRSELPELALQLRRLQADLAIQQRIRTSVQEQYEIARLSAESRTAFTVLEAAETPDTKIGPSRARISIMVTLAALAASIAISLFHYWIKQATMDPNLRSIITRAKAEYNG